MNDYGFLADIITDERIRTPRDILVHMQQRPDRDIDTIFICSPLDRWMDYNNRNGYVPLFGIALLHAAIYYRHTDAKLVEILLMTGANPDLTVGVSNSTALHLACFHCQDDPTIAKMLIKAGANINAQTIHGETPLSLAVTFLQVETVSLLIREGADVNISIHISNFKIAIWDAGGYHLFLGNGYQNAYNRIRLEMHTAINTQSLYNLCLLKVRREYADRWNRATLERILPRDIIERYDALQIGHSPRTASSWWCNLI